MTLDGAAPTKLLTQTLKKESDNGESMLQMISDYVVFLMEQSVPAFKLENLAADIKLITTLDKPEDLLVYSCLIAHKLSNCEVIHDVTEARLKTVRMHTAKMVLAFLSLLS